MVDAIAARAAAGPRSAHDPAAVAAAVAAVREGARLHYEVAEAADANLALLQGDERYARGLAALAELGDLDAIAELADTIALVATAHAAADEPLAEAAWEAGAAGIGWGPSPALATARARARTGAAGAGAAVRAAARQVQGDVASGR